MGNSSSSSSSVPCATIKVTNHRQSHVLSHVALGTTLSRSVASSLTTTTDQSSSLGTHQSGNTADEDAEHVYYEDHCNPRSRYLSESRLSVDCDYLEQGAPSLSDDGLHTASSFELVQPDACLFDAQQVPLSMLPQFHSVLGLSEQLEHSMSSCADSISSSSTTSSDSSSSPYARLGDHVRQPAGSAKLEAAHRRPSRKEPANGIRVPVMPLPRSKSFHQILRPTANGHILASNGTIRGASKNKSSSQVESQPLVSRVKHMFSGKRAPEYPPNQKRTELESILQQRLCKSESNLLHCSARALSIEQLDQRLASPVTDRSRGSSLAPTVSTKSVPAKHSLATSANHLLPDHVYQSAHSPVRPGRLSKEGSISKHSPIGLANFGCGAVATKVHRVKQHRNQSQQPAKNSRPEKPKKPKKNKRDLSPMSSLALGFLSSSSQAIASEAMTCQAQNKDNSDKPASQKGACKIKRSVSNFDASVYFRPREALPMGPVGNTIDSPWKLQRPNYENGAKGGSVNWYSQYLSFEFLNERIKSRLQQELSCQQRRAFFTDDSIALDYSRQDSAYQTSRSDDSKQPSSHCLDRGSSKLSCSEANLNSTPKGKAKGANGLTKRKSFKKLIEQYFVHKNPSCDCSDDDSLSSSTYATGANVFAQFDQNFILKRSTPNAGLTDQRLQQSNMKEYFDSDQAIYEKRTWRKGRPFQLNSAATQCTGNGRTNYSTIDRQLELFENILNQAEKQLLEEDKVATTRAVDRNGFHKSNLSLAEQSELSHRNEMSDHLAEGGTGAQLHYLKLIGHSENALCAKNQSKGSRPSQQQRAGSHEPTIHSDPYWTPLNDLSSESDYEEELYAEMLATEEEEAQHPSPYSELFLENLVDIEVEDFGCHQYRAGRQPPVPRPRQHAPSKMNHEASASDNVACRSSSPTGKPSARQLPNGPCFTLSNQLKTLLHNSNRMKSQNYFFY